MLQKVMGGVDGLIGEPAGLVLLVMGRLGHHLDGILRLLLVPIES